MRSRNDVTCRRVLPLRCGALSLVLSGRVQLLDFPCVRIHNSRNRDLFLLELLRKGGAVCWSTMARLNTRTSATPLHTTRSSTVDSLYRDPSVEPASRQDRSARNTTYSVISPAQSGVSDKENERPTTRLNSPTRTTKGKGLRTTSPRIPTPDSGPGHHGSKRRRTGDYAMRDSSIYEDGDSGSEDNQDDAQLSSESQDESEEDEELKFYNPNQDADVRRQLRARMRDHQRTVDGMQTCT